MSLYSRLLDPWLLGAYYGARGRRYGAHRRFLERSQWWPAEWVRELQWRELQKLLGYCLSRSPFYQRKYAGVVLQDIRSWEDFERLPVLERVEVNQHREEMRDPRSRERLILHATGGSSGTPTRFYLNRDSFDWRMAATARAYAWSGYRVGDRTLFLWGAPASPAATGAKRKLDLFHRVRGEHLFNTFRQDERLWAEILSWTQRARPKFVVGFVSSLEGFARYLLDQGQRLPGLQGVLTAAEPVSMLTRELVESALTAPLFNTYGSREFMSIGAECGQHDGLHINGENILVEVAGPGARGELLVTDLHNYGSPLVRYRIGDVGTLNLEPCGCGRGLPRLRSVDGRVTDQLRLQDGRLVSGLVFPHLIKEFPQIREYQVEQHSLDAVTLRLALDSPWQAGDLERLKGGMTRLLGASMELDIREVDAIPRLASGKRRTVIGLPPPRV
jgi:phenylacetate-CoA ligase